MAFVWDTIYALNLLLCIVILVLGIWGYRKKKDRMPLYIGMAFGLFGVSHLAFLLGFKTSLESFLVVVRLLAYLLVVYATYEIVSKK